MWQRTRSTPTDEARHGAHEAHNVAPCVGSVEIGETRHDEYHTRRPKRTHPDKVALKWC